MTSGTPPLPPNHNGFRLLSVRLPPPPLPAPRSPGRRSSALDLDPLPPRGRRSSSVTKIHHFMVYFISFHIIEILFVEYGVQPKISGHGYTSDNCWPGGPRMFVRVNPRNGSAERIGPKLFFPPSPAGRGSTTWQLWFYWKGFRKS